MYLFISMRMCVCVCVCVCVHGHAFMCFVLLCVRSAWIKEYTSDSLSNSLVSTRPAIPFQRYCCFRLACTWRPSAPVESITFFLLHSSRTLQTPGQTARLGAHSAGLT